MNIVTRQASKSKRYVCSGERTMRWYKNHVHKMNRRRVAQDLSYMAKHWKDGLDWYGWDLIPLKRGEMCTSWEIW